MAAVGRRILALSWMMPPLVYPRSLQVARTLKALSERGWQITVVTVDPLSDQFGVRDQLLEKYYEDAYRRRMIETREEVRRSPLWLRLWRRRSPPADISVDNWRRRAYRALLNEVARSSYDVFVSFAQPWIDHIVGHEVKARRPSLPWMAHFSDPWVDSPYLKVDSEQTREQLLVQERSVIENADSVAFVTSETAEAVMRKYPASWQKKAIVVPHGFDRGLVSLSGTDTATSHRMRIVYTGSFYPGMREPLRFLDVLSSFISVQQRRSEICVEFVGYATNECVDRSKSLGLNDIVTFHGRRGYFDSLGAMSNADLLLLIDAPAEHSLFLPSKIVEYLMAGKPILGITPVSGASAKLLRRMNCPVVDPLDDKSMLRELVSLYERWRVGELVASDSQRQVAEEFDIVRTTAVFETGLINAMAAAKRKL